MSQTGEMTPAASGDDKLVAAVRRSKAAWRRLGLRLRSITPDGLARFLLVTGALAVIIWVMGRSLVTLTPFLIGLTLAYITAPLVEALDRVLPRVLAVLLVMVAEVLLFLLVATVLVAPLVRELMQLIERLPETDQLRLYIRNLVAQLRGLPEPTQVFIRDGLRQIAVQLRDNLALSLQNVASLGALALLNEMRTFGVILGLLVLPTWLYSVMADEKRARRAVDSLVPERAKPDFVAVVQIVDRALSGTLRGLAVQGIAVGVVTYVGLSVVESLGLVTMEYKLLAAVLAGLVELIPDIGPFLWAIPAAIIGFSNSMEMGLALLGAYLIGRWLVHQTIVSRFERRVTGDIHPAAMVVAIVALSQFGVLWLFLAAPAVVIGRDLFRYAYGRLSDPPRPAGLLPGEPLPAPQAVTAVSAREVSRRRSRGGAQRQGEAQEPVSTAESG